jgi:hypothetical protein
MVSFDVSIAHTIEGITRLTQLGRTKLYEEIKLGRLKARKVGRRTVILDADLRQWLASLPTKEVAR